jgi:hypothetical protein
MHRKRSTGSTVLQLGASQDIRDDAYPDAALASTAPHASAGRGTVMGTR